MPFIRRNQVAEEQFVEGAQLNVDSHSEVIVGIIRRCRPLIEALQYEFARCGVGAVTLRFSKLQNLHNVHDVEAARCRQAK